MDNRKHEICRRCHQSRESTLDLATGRYTVTLPADCRDKERCERQMVPGERVRK